MASKKLEGQELPYIKRETQLNVSHENKFRVTFSDIPRLNKDKEIDKALFEDFVINAEYVPIQIDTITSVFMRHRRHHPADKGNQTLDGLAVTFKVTEYRENYLIMRKMVWDILNGERPNDTQNLVDYVFKFINCEFLDNNKRVISRTFHEDCLPTNISGLTMTNQTSEEQEFTVTFVFHSFDISLESIYD